MKILFEDIHQYRDNTIWLHEANGVDASFKIEIDGLTIPFRGLPDVYTQSVWQDDKEVVRSARRSLVELLNSNWAQDAHSFNYGRGRHIKVSTAHGTLTGMIMGSPVVAEGKKGFEFDEVTGEIVIRGFSPTEFEGAWNAVGAGSTTAYRREWNDIQVVKVESSLGTFATLDEYRAAREAAGLNTG